MNKTLRSTNKAIRDMARYFMSSSWGVRNCSCNTCCDRSGNCCWEECSAIDVTFTDWYRCYYDSTCTTPYLSPDQHLYLKRPPLDDKGNPITKFRLYPAPGGSPGSSSSGRTNMMGCEITAGRQHGQYWRTLKKHDFRIMDTTSGLPGQCPPPTIIYSSYLYVYYFDIPAVESGKRWAWAVNAAEEYRPSHGVNPDVPEITRMQLHSTEYRCCGADWDHTGECTESAPSTYTRDFQYFSIRPVSVTCCNDTNDRSGFDVGGEAGFSQACGLYTEGVAQDDDLWQNSTEYALYDVVRGDDTEQDTWAVSTEYFLNDVVKGDGGDDTFYTCITYHTSTSGDEPPYSTYWKVWVPPPEGQGVTKLKNFYRSRSAHTSTADDEPGVGAAWEAKWSSFHAKNPEFCPCINHSPEFEGGTANINCCASCYEDDCVDLPV